MVRACLLTQVCARHAKAASNVSGGELFSQITEEESKECEDCESEDCEGCEEGEVGFMGAAWNAWENKKEIGDDDDLPDLQRYKARLICDLRAGCFIRRLIVF